MQTTKEKISPAPGPTTDGISIILRCKNSAHDLPDLLDSLIAQNHKNLEIVALDNGSTDHSITTLRHYQTRLKITILSSPTATLSQLITEGVKHSTHETICIVDTDHICSPGLLQEITTKFPSHPFLYIPEVCHHQGWLTAIYNHEFKLYQEPNCGYPRVFPKTNYLKINREDIQHASLGEDHLLTKKLLPEKKALPSTQHHLRHKNIMSLRQLFFKHVRYGKTLAALPNGAEFVREKTSFFLLAFLKHFPRQPLLTTGVLCVKTIKLAGVLTGHLQKKPGK
jgi:glycosyltransferase involved in cell wall biosynthesis